MAGIGFELRKYLHSNSYLGTLKGYTYAGIISAGPWILSILGVMLVGILSVSLRMDAKSVVGFLVSVTWLMACSLMTTGVLLLVFIRFVADRLFEKADDIILPNVVGLLIVSTLVSGAISSFAVWLLFPDQSLLYRLLMVANFTTLCNMWFAVIFASGMKQYHLIIIAFCLGYLTVVAAAFAFQNEGLEGLLAGLFIGHCTLLFFMLTLIFGEYPGKSFVRFDFLKREKIHLRLAFIGFFYNTGLWVDKLLFWITPATSEPVIGPLRASLIYDLPIFFAYLSIVPGMAVFLIKFETDFVEAYDNYYRAVREGETLQKIERFSRQMQKSVQEGFGQIIKVQGLTVISIFLLSSSIINWLDISPRYLNLLHIDVVSVAIQVLLLSILNVLFYLDRLNAAFWLTLLLVLSNGVLTWLTLQLDPMFYGLGFCGAMLITSIIGIVILRRTFRTLEYQTFMLQA
jgi:uncharacterized membrane protein